MQTATEVISKVSQHPSSQTMQQSQQCREPKRSNTDQTFIYIWRGLQSGKFIAKSELVDGTEYKFWRHQLSDLSDEKLMAGLNATRRCDVEPYKLTWSKFREICKQATSKHASHQRFKPLPVKAVTPDVARRKMDAVYLANPEICPDRHRERLGL